jgi:hypothetical protein
MSIRTRLVAIASLLLASSFMVGSANPVAAAPVHGLNLTVWSMTERQMATFALSPWQSHLENRMGSYQPWVTTPPRNQICTTAVVPIVDTIGDPTVFSCQDDYVIAHYTGFITWPRSETVAFCGSQDDGIRLTLNQKLVIYDWYLQPSDWPCNNYGTYTFTANRPVAIDLWFYENWGGESLVLHYSSPATGGEWGGVNTSFLSPADCDRSSRSRERCRPTR